MTPITADMIDDSSLTEQMQAGPGHTDSQAPNGHEAASVPSVAEAIAERELKAILESMLFVSPEPLSLARLAAVLGDVTKAEIERVLRSLGDDLEQEGRGVRLAEIAGGFRLVTKQEYSTWIKRLDKAKSTTKLSRSALESLAIIAYKQPIVRSEIEEIRGVETSGVVRTLLERKLVRIVGRKEVPGRPIMYGTTKFFLEHFGLNDLSQLPPLREFKELGEAEQALLPMEEAASRVPAEGVPEKTDQAEWDQAAPKVEDAAVHGPAGRIEPEGPAPIEADEIYIARVEVDEAASHEEGTEHAEVSEAVSAGANDDLGGVTADQLEADEAMMFTIESDQSSGELAADEERKSDEELIGEPVEQG